MPRAKAPTGQEKTRLMEPIALRRTEKISEILAREILAGRTKRKSHAEFQLGARGPSRQFPRRDWLTFSAAA